MSQRTGSRAACILAWLTLLMVPIALIFGIGWPWLDRVNALERESAFLDDQIASYQTLLQTLPMLQAELEKVRSNKDVKDFYFDAKTSALAGAELQREVQDMVTSSGGRVTSTQLLPGPEDEQPPKVSVRTQIQGKTDALLDVLYEIERARPFLFVDQLTVRSSAQQRRSRSARLQRRIKRLNQRNQGQLTVRLDVFGYALGDSP